MSEYIIINKTDIQKRIEELEIEISYHHKKKEHLVCKELNRIKLELEELLLRSTPLIPEIEKAYNWGYTHCEDGCEQDVNDCTSNLKLDI